VTVSVVLAGGTSVVGGKGSAVGDGLGADAVGRGLSAGRETLFAALCRLT